MYAALIFSFAIAALIAFALKEKNMHTMETLFVWMSSTFVYASVTFLFSLNYSLFTVTQDWNGFMAVEVFRLLIVPLTITWAIDVAAGRCSWSRLAVILGGYVLYMCGFSYIFIKLDYITYHRPWNIGWSALMNTGIILALLLLKTAYHNLLRREVLERHGSS